MRGYLLSLSFAACGLWFTLGVSASISAQQRDLTLDQIFNPQHRVDFDGALPQIVSWLDNEHYLERDTKSSGPLLTVAAETGVREPLVSAAIMEKALTSLPGMSRDDARQLSQTNNSGIHELHTLLLTDDVDGTSVYDV